MPSAALDNRPPNAYVFAYLLAQKGTTMAKRTVNLTLDPDLVEFWDENLNAYASRSSWLNDLLDAWRRTGQEPSVRTRSAMPTQPVTRTHHSPLDALDLEDDS